MQVIDQINGSALFAQSAYSASIATKDSLGQDITATYLTEHQDLSNYATTGDLNNTSSFLSAAIDYVSANAGDEFPASANDAITAYQTYSGTYLTAHQSLDEYLTKTSADTLYQPIGNYALENDLEQVSGTLQNDIDYISGVAITAHQDISNKLDTTAFSTVSGTFLTAVDLSNYYTKSETSGATELANAFANIPAGDADVNAYVQNNSATINDVNSTVQTNSAQWGEGTSVDKIPVAVISPLVTGFSGESAYLGIESTALNLSSYVPVSAIGVNSYGYVSGISGWSISAGAAANASYAYQAGYADRANQDSNYNTITSYYQPKLTISGDAGTITSINGSAVGASIPEGWELVAGAGIEIVDDAENNQTTISVTAQGGDPEVESVVKSNSATWNEISVYETNSANYLTAHQSLDGYATETLVQNTSANITALIPDTSNFITNASAESTYQTISGMVDYQTVAGMTAYQPVGNYQTAGDYLTTADSANFYTTANESGFITSVDLTPYQTTAGMTAYQSAGDYYSASNPSGFISEVPDTYLQNTDLSTEDGKVTAISGIPLSAGGDVPEGVMVESGLEFNAVDEISGYNGSAIAQYGAEKQWLVHDDTIVSISNSAQYAFGCNISAIQRLMGIDETVLFENDSLDVNNGYKQTITLSEPYSAFKQLKFYYGDIYGNYSTYFDRIFNTEYASVSSRVYLEAPFGYSDGSSILRRTTTYRFNSLTSMTAEVNASYILKTPITASTFNYGDGSTANANRAVKVFKIVGIGRKS